jgi:hypothetical protein
MYFINIMISNFNAIIKSMAINTRFFTFVSKETWKMNVKIILKHNQENLFVDSHKTDPSFLKKCQLLLQFVLETSSGPYRITPQHPISPIAVRRDTSLNRN